MIDTFRAASVAAICLKKRVEVLVMGIPSYYKRLIDRYPALIKKGQGLLKSDILYMDFNCLIYYCLKSQPYTPDPGWEATLIQSVISYTVSVWNAAGRPSEVFIGVDGVVPMAKIRQQRLRRFKSVWLAAAEREAGVRGESWDSNAITPGTAFMEALGHALKKLGAARGWSISTADEPGEGEQKLMAAVRARSIAGKSIVVYGLDADLIVLSLKAITEQMPASWHLLREGGEFGNGQPYATLDICALLTHILPENVPDYISEYICAMSFLGNDFLPHSLTVKIRDSGHDHMLEALRRLHASGKRLTINGQVQAAAVVAFLDAWAMAEPDMLLTAIRHKYAMRYTPRTETERLMSSVHNKPIEWKAEASLVVGPVEKPKGLVENWKKIYYGHIPIEGACAEYGKGLQWIMDYYSGKPISYSWYYPWTLPPLWSDLKEIQIQSVPPTLPIAPQEQLAMVLPLESWALVRDTWLRGLPSREPIFWPSGFSFFSLGRRWMWECEAQIPVICVERLKASESDRTSDNKRVS